MINREIQTYQNWWLLHRPSTGRIWQASLSFCNTVSGCHRCRSRRWETSRPHSHPSIYLSEHRSHRWSLPVTEEQKSFSKTGAFQLFNRASLFSVPHRKDCLHVVLCPVWTQKVHMNLKLPHAGYCNSPSQIIFMISYESMWTWLTRADTILDTITGSLHSVIATWPLSKTNRQASRTSCSNW